MKNKGYSLIELMIVVAILGILLGASIGFMQTYLANTKIDSIAENVQSILQKARLEAIKTNSTVTLKITRDTTNAKLTFACTADFTGSFCDDSEFAQIRLASMDMQDVGAITNWTTKPVVFNSAGRVLADQAYRIIPSATDAQCKTATNPEGDYVCRRIILTTGGAIKTCNPTASNAAANC